MSLWSKNKVIDVWKNFIIKSLFLSILFSFDLNLCTKYGNMNFDFNKKLL